MRVPSFKTLSISLISIVFVLLSCQKQHEDSSQTEIPSLENMLEEAKTWFTNGPVLQEKEMLNLPYNILPEKSPKRIFARMVKMQNRLIWGNAKLINREGIVILLVPISMHLKEFDEDYDFAKFMIFSKNISGEIKGNVLEILSKKGTSIKGKEMEIASTAFYNRELNRKDLIDGINAYVFFYDEKYKKQNGFEITMGSMVATKSTLKIRKNDSIESNNFLRTTSCELWGMYWDHYDANGDLLYSVLLYTYYVGDCNGTEEDPTESGDPEGGGGGSGSSGGGDPNDLEFGLNAFKLNYEISSTSEKENSSLISESTTTRTKEYRWVCGKALLIKAISLEYGTHKKVNNEWQWESLIHKSVTLHGIVLGGSVSVTSHSGQQTLGIYNAIMSLAYSLHYNAIIPGYSPINWHVNKSAAASWYVNE